LTSCCHGNGEDRIDSPPDRAFAPCHDAALCLGGRHVRLNLADQIAVDRVDLGMLDSFLTSERAPSESMMLSDLDGFLTGIAIGPELVLPSEWLPLIGGGEAPEFADEAEASAILGTITGRYNEILRQVRHGALDPVSGPIATAPLSQPTGSRDSCRRSCCAQAHGNDCSSPSATVGFVADPGPVRR
jgi:hypothetical protein